MLQSMGWQRVRHNLAPKTAKYLHEANEVLVLNVSKSLLFVNPGMIQLEGTQKGVDWNTSSG